MNIVFYLSAVVTILAAALAITRQNAVHALLYLIVSLLAAALIFFALGVPLAAALEVIVYAGAIMVLFVFVVMTLNRQPEADAQESQWLTPQAWAGPALLVMVLLVELGYMLIAFPSQPVSLQAVVDLKQVGLALFGPYLLGVELVSLLLLAGLVGAYHLGRYQASESAAAATTAAPAQPATSTAPSAIEKAGGNA